MRPALAGLAVIVLAAPLAGCGGSRTGSRTIAHKLRTALVARDLPPHWVACVPTRVRLRGRTAFRCNVDFGDIHIEAYCAVLDRGQLAYAEWRQPIQGRQNRVRAQRECVRRLG